MDRRSQSEPFGRPEVPRSLPPELLAPTYQNRLRCIGRELDLHHHRSIVVLEVDGGFIVRAASRGQRGVELFQFPDESFPERMIQATEARGEGERGEIPSAIAPTGYEDLLRAVGRWLDLNQTANVALTEAPSTIVIAADRRRRDPDAGLDQIEATLDLTAIQQVLDESFRLRGDAGHDGVGA